MLLRAVILGCCFFALACQQQMAEQPKYKPLMGSTFFADGRASRPLVPGTVARGHLKTDTHLYLGVVDGQMAETFPFPVTRTVLERGQERYDIYCSPCHDRVGAGQGVVVQRGFQPPASFHIDRLREAPAGYFFTVITNGFGTMYDYAARINPEDRWAVIAYIRALQLSQRATLVEVPTEERARLAGVNP